MIEKINVTLECCQTSMSVTFDRKEAPGFPQGHFRTNVTCPQCGKLVILSLIKDGNHLSIEQKVIEA